MKELITAALICACEVACIIVAWRSGKNAGMRLGGFEYGLRLIVDVLSKERVERFCSEQNMGLLERRAVHKYVLHVLEYIGQSKKEENHENYNHNA